MRIKLPSFLSGTLGFTGLMLFVVGVAASMVVLVIDVGRADQRAYQGLLTFVVFPAFMAVGVGLMLLALAFHWRRRRAEGVKAIEFKPVAELFQSLTGVAMIRMFVIAMVIAMGAIVLSYHTYEFTESREFCGSLCHEPMNPQFVAHADSPHASIDCVECHVAPSVEGYVQAKLNGVHQLIQQATTSYPRPIRVHRDKLIPADVTCEHCHWEDQYWGMKLDTRARFGYDLESSRRYLQMYVKVGGRSPTYGPLGGIHFHMQRGVKFRAVDEDKSEIAWVSVDGPDGVPREYDLIENGRRKYRDSVLEEMPLQEISCLDCHNRPAHRFLSPDIAVDRALELGDIDRSLPSIKKVAVETLAGGYATKEEAHQEIDAQVRQYYADHFGGQVLERKDSIDRAIETLRELYARNVHPEMRVDWNTYPDHIGHWTSPGCFRCHGGDHMSRDDDKTPISNDCRVCHVFFEKGRESEDLIEVAASASYLHPFRHEKHFDTAIQCWDCHGDGATPYGKCASCHETETRTEVMRFECSMCHRPGAPGATAIPAATCASCHPMGDSGMHKHPDHADCMDCHQPHGWRVENEHESCAKCHAATEVEGWGRHSASGARGCDQCKGFAGVGATLMGLPFGPGDMKSPH